MKALEITQEALKLLENLKQNFPNSVKRKYILEVATLLNHQEAISPDGCDDN